VAESNPSPSSNPPVDLKDPLIAGILAWLVPGLGHFYQGRIAKGALFAICILGPFIYGLYLGGSKDIGWGRSVYFQFDDKEWRLYWLCQAGLGFPTVPLTLLQSKMGDKPLFDGFMAPPAPPIKGDDGLGPPFPPSAITLARINRLLGHYFELGTIYTVIAGLLNILAVYDACCGPVPAEQSGKGDEKLPGKREGSSGEQKP
jgi:hypothetical protein